MKGVFTLLLIMCLSLPNLLAEGKSLILTMVDGSVNAIALSDEPEITFPQDSIQVDAANFNLKINRKDFSFYSFGDFESTIIKEDLSKYSSVYIDNERLIVKGALAKTDFTLTDVEGRVILPQIKSRGDCYMEVVLGSLRPGVYLFVFDHLTFKFLKK
jgi:hypothetical protein